MRKLVVVVLKRIIIAVLVIFLIVLLAIIITLILDRTVFKHTPERALKVTFNISLKDFDYSVETFEEQWCPNGDGQALVIYKFNKLTQENIDYLKGFGLKPLPISEEECKLMDFNGIPKEYFKVNTGYYVYRPSNAASEPRNSWDYEVFVVDTVKNIAILYYQYM